MNDAVISRRRSEREAHIATARQWAEGAGSTLRARALVVVGSVARGDFNKWSDIDVLVVVDELPDGLLERLALLAPTRRPPGVEAILWTPGELAARRARGNDPLARDAYGIGVVVYG
ncbi:MAG: nucleotidyltransferase domain-containing protein, partial [Actinomycetota bacterium]|nr:nucleotidyltransferase domain-containing protein [Actinomycetota bacterium]